MEPSGQQDLGPRGQFDAFAEDYDELLRDPIRERFAAGSGFFHARKWELMREFLLRHAIGSEASWLDVGCGRGELLSLGRNHFQRAVGCDPSRGMARHSAVEVVRQDSPNQLPFSDKVFDFVTAVCVYHHVADEDRAGLTGEIARVLRPGGYACLVEHNPLNPATQWIVRHTPVDADARLLTAGSATRLFLAAGLQTVEKHYFLFLPERLYGRFARIDRWLRPVCLGGQYALFFRKRGS